MSLAVRMGWLLTVCVCVNADLFDWDPFCNTRCEEFLKRDECCAETMCRGNTLSKLFKSSSHYKMVQDCPQGGDLNMLCKRSTTAVTNRVEDLLPVTGNGTTFYNKHCALCYNVSDYDNWSLNITCSSYVVFQNLPSHQAILEKALNTMYCSVNIAPPTDVFPQDCLADPRIPFLGTKGLLPSDLEYDGFSNVNFYHSEGGRPNMPQISRRIEMNRKAPLSIILNFNTYPSSAEGVTTNRPVHDSQNCSLGQWRPSSQDTCHDVRCAKGKKLVGEKCVSVIDVIKGLLYHYSLNLKSTLGLNTTLCPVKNATRGLVMTMVEKLRTDSYSCTVNSRIMNESTVTEASESLDILDVSLDCKIVVTETVSRDTYEEELLSILGANWNLTCGENELHLGSNEVNGSLKQRNNSTSLSTTEIFLAIGENFYDFDDAENEFTEVSRFLLCRYVVFNVSQHHEGNKTGCVSVNAGNVVLCEGEFKMMENADVYACVDTLMMKYNAMVSLPNATTHTTTGVHVTIQYYLSYVCISLSMSCLLATFIVYLVFPSLRSLPAKNNICLILNLFFAQGLLQFGINLDVDRLACQIIGVLIHFFWLSALLSMNVCSYHMYSVFSYNNMAVMPRHSSTKRLVKYVAYTYTVAALIVATTIISQYIPSGGNTIGYGERYCYLSSAALVGFAFALPLAIILGLNVIMFVMAVRSIAQTSRIENEVLSRGRHNVQVYIKLSTLTGLFWVFGILAELFPIHALVYLSIALNGSQGVFIFIACVVNKRVLRLMKCTHGQSVHSSDKTKSTNLKSVSSHDTK